MLEREIAVIKANGEVTSRTEAVPELKENEVLIKVSASLISPGTEMNLPRQRRTTPDPKAQDLTFGYANAGEIIAVKGEVKGLRPGMRVAAMGGGGAKHASYACVPVNLVMPIPDSVSYEAATFACLGATAMHGIRRADVRFGEFGAILGLGIVGNLCCQIAQIAGCRMIGWEGLENRLAMAAACGIGHTVNFRAADPVAASKELAAPYGLDFAVLAFGGNASEPLQKVMSCMKVSADGHAMGNIVLIGGCKVEVGGGAFSGNLNIKAASRTGAGYHDPAWEYGRDYPEAFVQFTTTRNLDEVVRLIAEGRLQVEPMITHRMPLGEVGRAADLLIDHPDQAMGIILQMQH